MARINNGRNSRRKGALERAVQQLARGGYFMGTVFIKNQEHTVTRLMKEVETLKTRIL